VQLEKGGLEPAFNFFPFGVEAGTHTNLIEPQF